MSEPYVGEIRQVAVSSPPQGWAVCNGQMQSVAQNDSLFRLLGTSYGGDGRTTFGLPDLGSSADDNPQPESAHGFAIALQGRPTARG